MPAIAAIQNQIFRVSCFLTSASRTTPCRYRSLRLRQPVGVLLDNVIVPIRAFAGHFVEERRPAHVDGALRIAVFVQALPSDRLVDPLLLLVVQVGHGRNPSYTGLNYTGKQQSLYGRTQNARISFQ